MNHTTIISDYSGDAISTTATHHEAGSSDTYSNPMQLVLSTEILFVYVGITVLVTVLLCCFIILYLCIKMNRIERQLVEKTIECHRQKSEFDQTLAALDLTGTKSLSIASQSVATPSQCDIESTGNYDINTVTNLEQFSSNTTTLQQQSSSSEYNNINNINHPHSHNNYTNYQSKQHVQNMNSSYKQQIGSVASHKSEPDFMANVESAGAGVAAGVAASVAMTKLGSGSGENIINVDLTNTYANQNKMQVNDIGYAPKPKKTMIARLTYDSALDTFVIVNTCTPVGAGYGAVSPSPMSNHHTNGNPLSINRTTGTPVKATIATEADGMATVSPVAIGNHIPKNHQSKTTGNVSKTDKTDLDKTTTTMTNTRVTNDVNSTNVIYLSSQGRSDTTTGTSDEEDMDYGNITSQLTSVILNGQTHVHEQATVEAITSSGSSDIDHDDDMIIDSDGVEIILSDYDSSINYNRSTTDRDGYVKDGNINCNDSIIAQDTDHDHDLDGDIKQLKLDGMIHQMTAPSSDTDERETNVSKRNYNTYQSHTLNTIEEYKEVKQVQVHHDDDVMMNVENIDAGYEPELEVSGIHIDDKFDFTRNQAISNTYVQHSYTNKPMTTSTVKNKNKNKNLNSKSQRITWAETYTNKNNNCSKNNNKNEQNIINPKIKPNIVINPEREHDSPKYNSDLLYSTDFESENDYKLESGYDTNTNTSVTGLTNITIMANSRTKKSGGISTSVVGYKSPTKQSPLQLNRKFTHTNTLGNELTLRRYDTDSKTCTQTNFNDYDVSRIDTMISKDDVTNDEMINIDLTADANEQDSQDNYNITPKPYRDIKDEKQLKKERMGAVLRNLNEEYIVQLDFGAGYGETEIVIPASMSNIKANVSVNVNQS